MGFEKWKEQWLANYEGKSEAAKDLEGFMKSNYKGHKYIPWATMVKWLYLQDPEAKLDVLTDKVNDAYDGEYTSIVHISKGVLNNDKSVSKRDKAGVEVNESETIRTTHKANFVIIECTFLGKTFKEVYPIQDTSYNSPAFYDSNMVNKSIQRAKAKVISTATGLAFKLYEDGDLQFEEESTPIKKQNVGKQESIKEDIKELKKNIEESTKKDEKIVDLPKEVSDVINLIMKEKEKANTILKYYNAEIVKTKNYSISADDSKDELVTKIMGMKSPTLFAKSFIKRFSMLGETK